MVLFVLLKKHTDGTERRMTENLLRDINGHKKDEGDKQQYQDYDNDKGNQEIKEGEEESIFIHAAKLKVKIEEMLTNSQDKGISAHNAFSVDIQEEKISTSSPTDVINELSKIKIENQLLSAENSVLRDKCEATVEKLIKKEE